MAVNLVVYIFNNFVLKDLRKTFLKEPQKKKRLKNKYLVRISYLLQQKIYIYVYVSCMYVNFKFSETKVTFSDKCCINC